MSHCGCQYRWQDLRPWHNTILDSWSWSADLFLRLHKHDNYVTLQDCDKGGEQSSMWRHNKVALMPSMRPFEPARARLLLNNGLCGNHYRSLGSRAAYTTARWRLSSYAK